jgi:hypothetical protein
MSRTKKTAKKYYKGKEYSKSVKEQPVEEMDNKKPSGSNDPFWYATDPVLLRDSASIPWAAAAGTEQKLATELYPDKEYPWSDKTMRQTSRLNQGGVQVIKLAPTVGLSDKKSSPINIAMNSLYTKVRFQNSGHANYDAPDLMIYCLAMAEVYSAIQWLMRIYGLASLFTQRNRFVPEHILEAEGVDYDSIKHNLAGFRYGINLLIAKAASLCVPGTFTLFLRRAFVYSGVYTEGTSIKDQMYMYSPDGFYKYDLNTDGSGMLKYETMFGRLASESAYTADQLLDVVDGMLQRIIASEDCQIMSGDILKAYGENVLKLGTLSPEYTVTPTLDIPVLEQMKNCTVFPGYVNGNDIEQDTTHAYLVCDPSIAVHETVPNADYTALAIAPTITTTTGDPTPEVTMENTRVLSVIWKVDPVEQVDEEYFYPLHLYTGTEFATDIVYVAWPFMHDKIEKVWPTRYYWVDDNENIHEMAQRPQDASFLHSLATLNNFKFKPGYWLAKRNKIDDQTYETIVTYTVDVDNFTIQSPQVIRNLHETAIMSELNVPAINRLS